MYCTALVAPLFWIVLVDRPGAPQFPSKLSHIIVIVVINILAAVFFSLLAAGNKLNPHFSMATSFYMFIFSITLLYLGTVYHVNRLDAAGEFKQQEADFSKLVKEHRK